MLSPPISTKTRRNVCRVACACASGTRFPILISRFLDTARQMAILGRVMKFTKMHGIGNDYVYVNGFAENVADPAGVAGRVSDRHFGIGSDGLILILPPQEPGRADVRMRMFNVDGSEGEMCGNGVRCVAKYAYDHGLTRNNP